MGSSEAGLSAEAVIALEHMRTLARALVTWQGYALTVQWVIGLFGLLGIAITAQFGRFAFRTLWGSLVALWAAGIVSHSVAFLIREGAAPDMASYVERVYEPPEGGWTVGPWGAVE